MQQMVAHNNNNRRAIAYTNFSIDELPRKLKKEKIFYQARAIMIL